MAELRCRVRQIGAICCLHRNDSLMPLEEFSQDCEDLTGTARPAAGFYC